MPSSKELRQITRQLPLLLESLISTLRAGYSVVSAFQYIEPHLELPLRSFIRDLNQSVAIHQDLPLGLRHFAKSLPLSEVSFLCESLCLQHGAGGNPIPLLEKIQYVLSENEKLQRDIRSFTSQGKMSAWLIGLLWPCSLLLFWAVAPEHTHILFGSLAGQCLLIFSLLLQIIGFYSIWKIIRVPI